MQRLLLAAENGQPLTNAPRHAGGLWAKYTFLTPGLRGLGLAVGGNHVSNRLFENQLVPFGGGAPYWAY